MTYLVSKLCSVDAILFDFGGVLAEEGFRNGLYAIAKLNGIEPGPFIETGFHIIYEVGYVLGRSDERTYWQAMRKTTGIKGSDESLRDVILSHFKLRPSMIELIKELKASHLSLAILSDQTNWLDELDAYHDFFRWFERVFNSYHMGKGKRDPTLFDDVLALMDVEPGKALFVDDNHGNIERAKQKGLHAILYENCGSFHKELALFCPFLKVAV